MKFICTIVLFFIAGIYNRGICQLQPAHDHILVLNDEKDLPANAKKVGSVKGRAAPSPCGLERVFDNAIDKAKDRGGNIIVVKKVKEPSAMNNRMRLFADAYYADKVEPYIARQKKMLDSTLKAILPENAPYSLLYVSRRRNGLGTLVQYNLHADDDKLCRVKNGSTDTIKLYKEGRINLWARTESRKEVFIDMEPGKIYFLKCGVAMGLFVGHPDFYQVSSYYGIRAMLNQTGFNYQ
jgi:hypothetical protein